MMVTNHVNTNNNNHIVNLLIHVLESEKKSLSNEEMLLQGKKTSKYSRLTGQWDIYAFKNTEPSSNFGIKL